ncbi:MAG: hypothetical protein ACI8PB_000956 [Desulforhopalus sp.]|jgi:hypothetical protein
MIISPDYIVYIWLIPLVLFVLLPLSMLVVYLFVRFLHFMFFPKKMREVKVQSGIPERKMEKAL